MKVLANILAVILALFGLYSAGYWVFIKRDLVYRLPSSNDNPFERSGLQGFVLNAFEPAYQLDQRWNYDAPTRKRLIGDWKSESCDDFVTVYPTDQCEFRLGKFTYMGPVEYRRDLPGFTAEFTCDGNSHVFIISLSMNHNGEVLAEDFAGVFIMSYCEPGVREIDDYWRLTKR